MKENNLLYVDVHVLQTVPPSCINRDDTGSPKTASYGGVTRARISSQAWKRAMRMMFRENYPFEKLAERTLKIIDMVADEIRSIGDIDNPEKAAENVLSHAGLKIRSIDKGTGALFFMSSAQAQALAKLVVLEGAGADKVPKEVQEKAKRSLRESPGIDIALFGRMVADDPSLNTDASAQVAHSISTHRVTNEYDYFTAVDDRAPEDTAGAGHIGTVEFNSATLYRYATIAVHELEKQLGDDTAMAVVEFVRAFALSMPTGKQNTFANRTTPEMILVTIRNNQPVNLVGAFERPVIANDSGYIIPSAARLVEQAKKIYHDFAGEPVASLVTGALLSELGSPVSFDELLENLRHNIDTNRGSLGERL
jgi:CRISPR system Cascade subunit CasC